MDIGLQIRIVRINVLRYKDIVVELPNKTVVLKNNVKNKKDGWVRLTNAIKEYQLRDAQQ